MKKILLATSALAAIASFGASAHVRDGLVESSHNRLELAITGEISAAMGYTSFKTTTYADADADGVDVDSSGFGQTYSADIDFTATTHVRNWQIKGVVELNVGSTGGYNFENLDEYEVRNDVLTQVFDKDGNAVQSVYLVEGDRTDALSVGDVYVDFTAPYGTFRVGKGAGPSDELSLEAELPGFDLENVTGDDNFSLSNARFADSYNQIGYYSPNWNGFQFGVAYGFGMEDNSYVSPEYNDFVEAAAKYSGEWNAFSFAVSAAYRAYLGDGEVYYKKINDTTFEPAIYNNGDQLTAGVALGYMGFNWTTTYGQTDIEDGDLYGIKTALTYNWDRWTVGAAYEHAFASNEKVLDNLDQEYTRETDFNSFGVGAEYRIFDGLTWNAAINYAKYDVSRDYASDVDAKDYTAAEGSVFQILTGFDLEW